MISEIIPYIARIFSYITLRFSEAANPVIYIIGSQALRETVQKLFGVRLSSSRRPSYRHTNIQNHRNLQNPNQVSTIRINPPIAANRATTPVNLGASLTLDSGICDGSFSGNT